MCRNDAFIMILQEQKRGLIHGGSRVVEYWNFGVERLVDASDWVAT